MEAWSKVSKTPRWGQGYSAGWRPTSAAVLALASWRPGMPKRCAYHAEVPTATAVAPYRAVREAKNDSAAGFEKVELKRACARQYI